MPTEARPNLFLVGAQKCGTSALAGWLGQHPQVLMSFPKEPGYLAFGASGYDFRDGYGNAPPASKYVVRSERDYLRLFAGAGPQHRLLGEASSWYLTAPGMAKKIKTYSPNAKIIVMFRDPVERAYSAWCHARSDGVEPCEDFAAALEQESQRGDVEFLLRYRRMGLYSQALASYQACFDSSRLLVLFHEDLRSEPGQLWRRVCAFGEIDATFQPAFADRYNQSGEPRNRLLHSLLRSHRLKSAIRRVLPHQQALRIKQRLESANLQQFPPMVDATRAQLRAYYREDIEALSRMTGRDLGAWLQ